MSAYTADDIVGASWLVAAPYAVAAYLAIDNPGLGLGVAAAASLALAGVAGFLIGRAMGRRGR